MNTFLKIMTFFLVNAIGFNIGPLFYVLALKFEAVDINAETFNPNNLQFDLVFAPGLTWIVCFVFSFAFFFLKSKWRKIFLFAPAVLPFLHACFNLVLNT